MNLPSYKKQCHHLYRAFTLDFHRRTFLLQADRMVSTERSRNEGEIKKGILEHPNINLSPSYDHLSAHTAISAITPPPTQSTLYRRGLHMM